MAYLTIAEFKTMFPVFSISTSSSPTQAQTEAMIPLVEGVMNAALRANNYSPVPVTDSDAVELIKMAVLDGVAGRYLQNKLFKTASEEVFEAARYHQRRFDDFLRKLEERDNILRGAGRADNSVAGGMRTNPDREDDTDVDSMFTTSLEQ